MKINLFLIMFFVTMSYSAFSIGPKELGDATAACSGIEIKACDAKKKLGAWKFGTQELKDANYTRCAINGFKKCSDKIKAENKDAIDKFSESDKKVYEEDLSKISKLFLSSKTFMQGKDGSGFLANYAKNNFIIGENEYSKPRKCIDLATDPQQLLGSLINNLSEKIQEETCQKLKSDTSDNQLSFCQCVKNSVNGAKSISPYQKLSCKQKTALDDMLMEDKINEDYDENIYASIVYAQAILSEVEISGNRGKSRKFSYCLPGEENRLLKMLEKEEKCSSDAVAYITKARERSFANNADEVMLNIVKNAKKRLFKNGRKPTLSDSEIYALEVMKEKTFGYSEFVSIGPRFEDSKKNHDRRMYDDRKTRAFLECKQVIMLRDNPSKFSTELLLREASKQMGITPSGFSDKDYEILANSIQKSLKECGKENEMCSFSNDTNIVLSRFANDYLSINHKDKRKLESKAGMTAKKAWSSDFLRNLLATNPKYKNLSSKKLKKNYKKNQKNNLKKVAKGCKRKIRKAMKMCRVIDKGRPILSKKIIPSLDDKSSNKYAVNIKDYAKKIGTTEIQAKLFVETYQCERNMGKGRFSDLNSMGWSFEHGKCKLPMAVKLITDTELDNTEVAIQREYNKRETSDERVRLEEITDIKVVEELKNTTVEQAGTSLSSYRESVTSKKDYGKNDEREAKALARFQNENPWDVDNSIGARIDALIDSKNIDLYNIPDTTGVSISSNSDGKTEDSKVESEKMVGQAELENAKESDSLGPNQAVVNVENGDSQNQGLDQYFQNQSNGAYQTPTNVDYSSAYQSANSKVKVSEENVSKITDKMSSVLKDTDNVEARKDLPNKYKTKELDELKLKMEKLEEELKLAKFERQKAELTKEITQKKMDVEKISQTNVEPPNGSASPRVVRAESSETRKGPGPSRIGEASRASTNSQASSTGSNSRSSSTNVSSSNRSVSSHINRAISLQYSLADSLNSKNVFVIADGKNVLHAAEKEGKGKVVLSKIDDTHYRQYLFDENGDGILDNNGEIEFVLRTLDKETGEFILDHRLVDEKEIVKLTKLEKEAIKPGLTRRLSKWKEAQRILENETKK